jgi:hypothetical protein
MATYVVTGHPLNLNDTGLTPAGLDAPRASLQATGVGGTFTVTLNGPDDTKAKGHGCLR